MQNELNKLIDAINADYAGWDDKTKHKDPERVQAFADAIVVREGKKYIKIITGSSVWGFIVNCDDDKQFKRGDILKPAGWKAPARNHARGNIFDGAHGIRWTGPTYCGTSDQAKNDAIREMQGPLDDMLSA